VTDPIGRLVAGKYRVRKKLGKGGFGAVYEAEHVEIEKRVAIKTIDKAHAAVPERVARFKREARIAGSVESEHIVHVFDTGEDDELGLYMVMELLHGEDLASRLVRRGKLPPEEAVRIAWQAARGLAKAHAAGVVHRDLKPANVYLCAKDDRRGDSDVLVKVVDFGVSKLLGDKEQITRAGMTMGTPQYMAPEQVRGGNIDARADVWALGAVLYEMLAGRPAYPLLESYEMTFMSIATSRPRPLALVAPDVPAPLVAVVERALSHDAHRRYADARLLATALVEALPHVFPDALRRQSTGSLETAGVPKRGAMRTVVIGALVLAVGAAIVFVAMNRKNGNGGATTNGTTATTTATTGAASTSAATTSSNGAPSSTATTTATVEPTTTTTTPSAPETATTGAETPTKPTTGKTSNVKITKPTATGTATTKPTDNPFGATGVSTQY
jgi:serine/threonine-protein kinase